MNTILWNSTKIKYQTDLKTVFDSLGGRQKEFNWLITDFESTLEVLYGKQRVWISGEDLTELVYKNKPQFIWGVLSAFSKSIKLDIDNLEVEPDITMNNEIWQSPIVRHPLAICEIVCWDSSATMLLSKDDDLTNKFRKFFPESIDFNDYIRKEL